MTRSGLRRVVVGSGVRNGWLRFGRLSRWGLIGACEPESADESDDRTQSEQSSRDESPGKYAAENPALERLDPQEDVGRASHRQPGDGRRPGDLECQPGERPAVRSDVADQVGRKSVTDGVARRQMRGAIRQTKGWNQRRIDQKCKTTFQTRS